VVGTYKTLGDVEAAVRSLGDGGFPIQKVSIIAKHLEDDRRVRGYKIYAESFKDQAHLDAIVHQAQQLVSQALTGGVA